MLKGRNYPYFMPEGNKAQRGYVTSPKETCYLAEESEF